MPEPTRSTDRQVRPPDGHQPAGATPPTERELLDVLDHTTALLDDAGIDHVVMGGIAVAALARPRWTHDLDLLLRPDDAADALELLADAGYETQRTDPLWLFKAWRNDVMVDLIFASEGGYYLDEALLERARRTQLRGQPVRVISPEDLIVIKVAAHQEDAAHHWFDALALLLCEELDWDYLLRRARRSVRRMLSLLLYAESLDLAVPPGVVAELARLRHDGAAGRQLASRAGPEDVAPARTPADREPTAPAPADGDDGEAGWGPPLVERL